MMNTTQFLSTVLGDDGFYCIYAIRKKDGKHVQKFYSSIDSINDSALNFDHEGYDAYFGLGTFVEDTNRKAENVSQMRAFFLDIDCGEGKPYPDKAHGIHALQGFCKELSLPIPTLTVDSGRGLHVYWALAEPCTKQAWLPIASRLKMACVENGFEVDPAVTSDMARILRVPGTRNFKSTPPSSVRILGKLNPTVTLEQMSELLPNEGLVPALQERQYTKEDRENAKNLLSSNLEKKFTNILVKTAAGKGCAQIDRAIKKPDELSYNDWTHVLSIAKHCDEPEAIHIVSSRYAHYSAHETEKVADSLHSPHLCTTFEADNPAGCVGCPMRGKINTPIKLSYEIREATEEDNIIEIPLGNLQPSAVPVDSGLFADETEVVTTVEYKIPTYPAPYFRGGNGGVFLRKRNKEGEIDEIEVHDKDLYLTKRITDPVDGPCFEFKHHTTLEGIVTFVVQGTSTTSKEKFREEMGKNDIHLMRPEILMNYIQAWIKELQISKTPIDAKTQFGWTKDYGSFVVGDREIFADHLEENPPSAFTAKYMPMFQKRGTLEDWKEAVKFYERPDMEPHQFMVATAFGSPLMKFMPNSNGFINHVMSSYSGYGKSTGMIVGASVWGSPEEYIMVGQSTDNGIWNRAEAMKNLPIYIDEITNLDAGKISDICYAITSGRQKTRMTSGGQNKERYTGEAWALIMSTNGNKSLVEIMTAEKELPKGELQRLIETELIKLDIPQEETLALNVGIQKNCGHAGEVLMQKILKDTDAVEKLLFKIRAVIIRRVGMTDQNRNWSAGAACVVGGSLIAKRCGLWDIDIEALLDWTVQQMKRMMAWDKQLDLDVEKLVKEYFYEKQGAILRIKSTDDARRTDGSGLHVLIEPDKTPFYSWVGRYEFDIGRLYLLPTPFKKWCAKRGAPYPEVVRGIIALLGGKNERIKLGKGTPIQGAGSTYVLSLVFDSEDGEEYDGTPIPKNLESLYEPPK